MTLQYIAAFTKAESGVDAEARIVNQRLWFRGKDGKYTIVGLEQENGNYMLLSIVVDTIVGPQTWGYLYMSRI